MPDMPRHLYGLDLDDGSLLLLTVLYGFADADEHAAAMRGAGGPAFVWPSWAELIRTRRAGRSTIARQLKHLSDAGQIRRATRTVGQMPERARTAMAHLGPDFAVYGWELTPSDRPADETVPPTRPSRRRDRPVPLTRPAWSREVGLSRLSVELDESPADETRPADETIPPTRPSRRRDDPRPVDETAPVPPMGRPASSLPPNPPPTYTPGNQPDDPTTTTTDTSAAGEPATTETAIGEHAEHQDHGDPRHLSHQVTPQPSPYRPRVVARRPVADEPEVDGGAFDRTLAGSASSILLEARQLFTPCGADGRPLKGRQVGGDRATEARIRRLVTPPDGAPAGERVALLKARVAFVLEYLHAFADLCQVEQLHLGRGRWKLEETKYIRWWGGLMFELDPLPGKRHGPWDMLVKAVDDHRAAQGTATVGAEVDAAEAAAKAAAAAAEEAKPRVDVSTAAADFLRTLGPPTKAPPKASKLAPPRVDELKSAGDVGLAALRKLNANRRAGLSFDDAAAAAQDFYDRSKET